MSLDTHWTPQSTLLPSNGFTLVEIVMTISLLGILSAVAAVIILQGVTAYTDESMRSDVQYQARLALERISREARLIASCQAGDLASSLSSTGTLSFNDINGTAVSFSVSGGTLYRGTNILATGLTSSTPFSFLSSDLTPTTLCPGIWFIDIALRDTRGPQSLSLRTRVHPRNF